MEYGEAFRENVEQSHEYQPNAVAGVAMRSGEVIYRLYDTPSETVIVPIESPASAEPMFLEVWSQQWPRLRRSFTFCTGAISGRKLEGEWFDLLGVPASRFDDVQRTIKNSVVAKPEARASLDKGEKWFNAVMDDFGDPERVLRKYLFEFGAEAENGRLDFVPMTELFLALNNSTKDPVVRVIKALRAVFPRGNMGTKLKARLLAGEIGADVLKTPSTPLQLMLLSRGELFDTTAVQLRNLAQLSWAHDPSGVIDTIDRMIEQNGTVDNATMAMLAETLDPSQVTRIGKWSETLGRLVSYRPMLLAHEALRDVEGRNVTLLEYLSSPRAAWEEVRIILSQWLKEAEFGQVEAASEQQPKAIVPEVLNLMIVPKNKTATIFQQTC